VHVSLLPWGDAGTTANNQQAQPVSRKEEAR
jgi:hypothetical protein